MNIAVHWRVMNAGLPCNLTRGLMHFNACTFMAQN